MIENTFGINIIPDNEAHRLKALKRYKITDTPSEESFDGIVKLTAQILGVPIALLSLVDSESVFFKASVGMGDVKKSNRGKSLCALAILDKEVIVFEDALKESCLQNNPNVTGDFGLRFYAGAPLVTFDGFLIGTLCIIDQKPRELSNHDRLILEGLAKTAMDQIELRRSSLETIEQLNKVNNELSLAKDDLHTAVHKLEEFNAEMEATNDELNSKNIQLNQSYDLTTTLNEDLKTNRQRLESFIRKAPVAFGILTGRNLVIEVANEMILKVWGKKRDVVGKPLAEALPELKGQPYLSILDDVFISGHTYTGDTAPVKLDINGELHDSYFDFIYEPLKNDEDETVSIIVIANEVTDRIHKNKELENLNQQLSIALDAGQLGSYNLDIKTGIMTCSDICKANYGLTKHDCFNFEDLINTIVPEYRDMVNEKVSQSLKTGKPYQAEYLIRWADGSLHWMSASGLPSYDADGHPKNMIGVTVDITTRKNYETQKDDFLGIASHELKTPITSLKATIQLLTRLKENPNHPMIPRLIDQSAQSLEKLNSLVDDLLNMHRISEGQLRLERESFNVAKMLEKSFEYIRFVEKYQLIIDGDFDANMYADEHRIEQVVINFVNNAMKYAPTSDKIIIEIKRSENKIKVSVKDFGEGIDASVQPYLFDRYYRVNHEGKKYSGLGLGLYISSEIIKRHDGEIGVESILGEGSTFWFTIPTKINS